MATWSLSLDEDGLPNVQPPNLKHNNIKASYICLLPCQFIDCTQIGIGVPNFLMNFLLLSLALVVADLANTK